MPETLTEPVRIKSVNDSVMIPSSMSRLNNTNSGGALSKVTLLACNALPLVMATLSSRAGPSIVLAVIVIQVLSMLVPNRLFSRIGRASELSVINRVYP